MDHIQTQAPIDIIAAGNTVGECIVWDWRQQALWWTDIPARRLHRYDWASGRTQVLSAPDRIGSFGLVAGSERLIVAFAGGIALYHPFEGSLSWIAQPEALVSGLRFNDGRVDRRGRFWCGTMVEDALCAATGSLYSVGPGGELRCHLNGIRISNGLSMSPDGSRLYFADSPTHTIVVHDLLEPQGRLGAPQTFARTPLGEPDGAAIDAEGCLWSAQWGGSCIARFTPDGQLERTIAVPTTQPSCVCFGGPDLDLLFVTSARENLHPALLENEPHAGDVFVYRTGIRGLPEQEYRL